MFIILLCNVYGVSHFRNVRALKLNKFFLDKAPNTPLIGHEQEIVYCADKWKLDYRLYVAISGVESSFGKRYLRYTNNLTGIGNGYIRFKSIYDNIYKTHELIATHKAYEKYRKTNKIKDLVYSYKGVPPWEPYTSNLIKIMKDIDKIEVCDLP